MLVDIFLLGMFGMTLMAISKVLAGGALWI